jgi:hypothetical protein
LGAAEESTTDLPAGPAGVVPWCPDHLDHARRALHAIDPKCLAVQEHHLVALGELRRLAVGHHEAGSLKAVDQQLAMVTTEEWLVSAGADGDRQDLDPDVWLRHEVPTAVVIK